MSGWLFLHLIISYLPEMHTGDSLMSDEPLWTNTSFLGIAEEGLNHPQRLSDHLTVKLCKDKNLRIVPRSYQYPPSCFLVGILIAFLWTPLSNSLGTLEWPLTHLPLTSCFSIGANKARPGREPRWGKGSCEGWGDLSPLLMACIVRLRKLFPLHPEDYWK